MTPYAGIIWTIDDIKAIAPELSDEQCHKWWWQNEKWFREVLIEYGNEILQNAVNLYAFTGLEN